MQFICSIVYIIAIAWLVGIVAHLLDYPFMAGWNVIN